MQMGARQYWLPLGSLHGAAAPTAGHSSWQLPHTESLWLGATVELQPHCCGTAPLLCASFPRCFHPHPACTCWESQFPWPALQ